MVNNAESLRIYRGDIVRVNLDPTRGQEQKGNARPCVIIQNDVGNMNSPTTIIAPITDAEGRKLYPFQAFIEKGDGGLAKDSIALCEQIRVIDKRRIIKNLGHLRQDTIDCIDRALNASLDL